MKSSYLQKLKGLIITDISTQNGQYHPINAENKDDFIDRSRSISEYHLTIGEYSLTISNPFEINGADELSMVKGLSIESIEEKEVEIIIALEKGKSIVIDMREESYKGPEALCLQGPDNLIVVWN